MRGEIPGDPAFQALHRVAQDDQQPGPGEVPEEVGQLVVGRIVDVVEEHVGIARPPQSFLEGHVQEPEEGTLIDALRAGQEGGQVAGESLAIEGERLCAVLAHAREPLGFADREGRPRGVPRYPLGMGGVEQHLVEGREAIDQLFAAACAQLGPDGASEEALHVDAGQGGDPRMAVDEAVQEPRAAAAEMEERHYCLLLPVRGGIGGRQPGGGAPVAVGRGFRRQPVQRVLQEPWFGRFRGSGGQAFDQAHGRAFLEVRGDEWENQVLVDLEQPRFEAQCRLAGGDGALHVAQVVEGETQVAMPLGVIGIDGEGVAVALDGAFQVAAFLPRDADVDVGGGIARVDLDGALQMHQRLGRPLQLEEGVAQVVQCLGMARVAGKGAFQGGNGVFDAAQPFQGQAHVAVGVGEAGIVGDGAAVGSDRLVGPPQPQKRVAERVVGGGMGGVEAGGTTGGLRRLLVAALGEVDDGDVAMGRRIAGMMGDRRLQPLQGLVVAAQLVAGQSAQGEDVDVAGIDAAQAPVDA